ncbi:MAG: two-component system OmpR family response regulator [Acidimicrobiales bacterium]|jgi:two-component system, OmpR family, response regulator
MRLLIVEDEDDIALVIQQALTAEGHLVDRAANGPDGLWKACEGSYGLILLDVLLPGMNGFKVCEAIRAKGIDTPVLMLTAKVGDYDEAEGLDDGADDYLRKPFSHDVLRARVRALLRRGARGGVHFELTRGGVVFDPASRSCSIDGEPVDLTGRQSQVLETLLRSESTPVSRGDLVSAVWGFEFEGDPNVADVYIGYLRNKLGKATIENVRGLGFRVRA